MRGTEYSSNGDNTILRHARIFALDPIVLDRPAFTPFADYRSTMS